tara:strand:+ start:627 stop:1376 length:750 start_codon:yes stop_codon:yes gene_type:complete
MSTSIPASREELKAYAKRQLGDPVVEINVDPDQEEDVLELSLQFFQQYHFDATEKVYLSHKTTAADIANKYITVGDAVVAVERVLPFSSRTRGIDLFDVRYQILLNDLYSIQSTDIIYYYQVQRQLTLMNDLLVGIKPVRFNRYTSKLHIDMNWEEDIDVDEFIVIEAFRILDPNEFTKVYNDLYLKKYVIAQLKKIWGMNLKKFSGVTLPGGVQLNGQIIYDEAIMEIKELEADIDSRYQLPIDFFQA